MRNETEIKEAIKDKEKELAFINNPPKIDSCKLCGHSPAIIIGGDEPWADLGGYKRRTLNTEIRILEWILEGKQ